METSMGGDRAAFPETLWSSILGDKNRDEAQRREKLNRLLSLYWRPIYTFVRLSARKPVEEAKDLTQEFFIYLLEGDVVTKYQPGLGRFRHFLKGVLKNFLASHHRDAHALKRGGAATVVPLDVAELESGDLLAGGATPDELFDRQWARDVMMRSLDEIRTALAAEGKQIYMEIYEAYDLAGSDRPTYDDLARTHKLTVWDVKNYLDQVRDRLQKIVKNHVSDYVASREDLAAEMNELFR